ncbi:MAG: hypothetical protein MUF83_16735 [Acidimicrobiales bacterium]|nr:hypothetical protein [Acidimicrobiales bacterium]
MSTTGAGLSRRTVLAAIVGVGAALTAGAFGYLAFGPADDDDDDSGTSDDLTATVPTRQALLAVGERYLATHPEEADTEVLLAALAPLGGSIPADPDTQLAVLGQQVSADYAAGDVVELDGWVLSRTEGRAAALFVLER